MKNVRLWMIIVLAASLRIAYWLEVKNEAWFIAPGTDPEFYLNWGSDILNDNAAQYIPFQRAPLYPYIVAGIQGLFGSSWLWLRLFNLLCDLMTIVLIFHIAVHIADRKTGIFAALIFSLSGASIYFTGEVLMTSLATLCMTSIVYTLSSVKISNLFSRFIIAGIALGTMALLRPNIFVILPFTILYAYFMCHYHKKVTIRFIVPTLHLSAAVLILMPTTLINYHKTGRFIPVSTQGGVNFLIGNVRGADGWSSTLPTAGSSWSNDNAIELASGFAGRDLAEADVSPVFWKMGLQEIASDPLGWLRLMIKKALLFINVREIANNRPFLLPSESSSIFEILSLVSLGALFPLSLIGLIRYHGMIEVKALAIIALLYALSIILFFVTTRYRTPIFPIFAILGALGITNLLSIRKNEKYMFGWMFVILIGVLLSFPSWGGKEFGDEIQAKFIVGNAHLRLNQPLEALAEFKLASELEPGFFELNLNTGVAWLRLGDTVKAEEAFLKEVSHWQDNPKAYNNLGVIREGQGSISGAVRYYKKSLSADASFIDARVNLARIYKNRGDAYAQAGILDSASLYYNQVVSLKGASAGLLHRLAILELQNDNLAEAMRYLQHGLILDPEFTPSENLLRELRSQE